MKQEDTASGADLVNNVQGEVSDVSYDLSNHANKTRTFFQNSININSFSESCIKITCIKVYDEKYGAYIS